MTIVEQKKAIRKTMMDQRNHLDSDYKNKYDTWISEELIKQIDNRNAQVVHSYIPFLSEINIRPVLQYLLDKNIRVICPKTLPKRKLENRILHSLAQLETGIMGTLHPADADLYDGPIDFVIIPGLAFDSSGYRLGYGGGYYDNFLIGHSDAETVGIFYPFQHMDQVPTEAHDIRLKKILSRN